MRILLPKLQVSKDKILRENIKNLYGIEDAPSANQLRSIIDKMA